LGEQHSVSERVGANVALQIGHVVCGRGRRRRARRRAVFAERRHEPEQKR
jgi:hypothetical protein